LAPSSGKLQDRLSARIRRGNRHPDLNVPPYRTGRGGNYSDSREEAKQGSISFVLCCRGRWRPVNAMLAKTDKSFLVLFFKKELLSWHLPAFRGAPPRPCKGSSSFLKKRTKKLLFS
jgi:hypothetical protein